MSLKFLRRVAAFAFSVAALLPTALFAQTCSVPGSAGALSSSVSELNSYFAGTGSPAINATSIAVAAGVGFANINSGDLLLVIQMQGADIDATNTRPMGRALRVQG